MAVQAAVLLARMAGAPCVRAKQSAVESPLHGVLNDTRQYRAATPCKRGEAEAQLGVTAKAMSKLAIGDGVLWISPCKRRRSLKRSLEIAKPER